jgi:hypothetical protein
MVPASKTPQYNLNAVSVLIVVAKILPARYLNINVISFSDFGVYFAVLACTLLSYFNRCDARSITVYFV